MLRNNLFEPAQAAVAAADLVAAIVDGSEIRLTGQDYVVTGPVDLTGVTVRAPITIRRTRFTAPVTARGTRFAQDLALTECQFTHGLDLTDARCLGHLHLTGSTIEQGDLQGTTLRVTGHLEAAGLRLAAGNLDLSHGRFSADLRLGGLTGAAEVRLNYAHVQGTLQFQGNPSLPGKVDLTLAQIGTLTIGGQLAAGQQPVFRLNGLRFAALAVTQLKAAGTAATDPYELLLDLSPAYDASVHQAVENWLRNQGETTRAKAIYLDARRREIGRKPGAADTGDALSRLGKTLLLDLVGYGVCTRKAVALFLGLFLGAWVIFSTPGSVQRPLAYSAPWAVATEVPATNSPAYLTLTNTGSLSPQTLDSLWISTVPLVTNSADTNIGNVLWVTVTNTVEMKSREAGTLTLTGALPLPAPAIPQLPRNQLDLLSSTNLVWGQFASHPEPAEWTFQDGFWMAFRVTVPVLRPFTRSDWEPSNRDLTILPLRYDTLASLLQIAGGALFLLILAAWAGWLRKK